MRSMPFQRAAAAPLLLCALTLTPTGLLAQNPPAAFGSDSTLVDRVVAVVGDSVILASEVQERRLAFGAQGQNLTDRQVLDDLIDQQLILQEAARDSTLAIPEEELEARVEASVSEIRARFPTEAAFRRALDEQGMTIDVLRVVQRSGLRAQLTQDLYMQRQLQEAPAVAVTEEEMREFYEERRATLQGRPELLTVEQVLVPVQASDSAWADARRVTDSLHQAIEAGADFQEVAREYSDDPGSAADGGDLGWFRRGLMVREFESVAFALRPTEMSGPVRTEFGWHLILTERSRPGEVKARHILIRPDIVESDRQEARARAEEIAEGVRAGEAMSDLYHDDDEGAEEYERNTWSRAAVAQIPYEGFAQQLAEASEGDLLGPFQTRAGNQEYFAVIRVEEVRSAGEFTFEDLREEIRNGLSNQKKLDRVLQRLRDRGYIEIRM
jgi:peptidyl-prolyl cis-trans isomerase SurA